jgi:hypothetical protein
VQHEGHPLARRQAIQHDQQRQSDRFREQRLLLGVCGCGRFGHHDVHRLFPP